jgi:hypothetical protein
MPRFFSPSTNGFFISEINDIIPEDAVEITEEEHVRLFSVASQGKPIKADVNGRPYNEEPPPRTLTDVKAAKLAALAAHRYAVETSGLTINGATIMTDRSSQAMWTCAYVACQINPARLIDFKGVNGWQKIDAATVFQISSAVTDHVQAMFSTERNHATKIEALTTIAKIDAYDFTTGW